MPEQSVSSPAAQSASAAASTPPAASSRSSAPVSSAGKPAEEPLPPGTKIDLLATPFVSETLKQKEFQATLTGQGNHARLAKVMDKAKKGGTITVGSIGGSITEGALSSGAAKSYTGVVASWFRKTFPQCKIETANAGVGATGSMMGVFRIAPDLLAKSPDLVVVEYAVNDAGDADDPLTLEAYEGVVRRILMQPNQPAVMLLFMVDEYGRSAQHREVEIGRKYDLPMVSWKDGVEAAFGAGYLTWKDISPDNIHPNDRGHQLAGDLLCHRLQAVLDNLPGIDRTVYKLPSTDNRLLAARVYDNKTLPLKSKGAFTEANNLFYHGTVSRGWTGTALYQPLVFETTSEIVGFVYKMQTVKRGATAEVLVNGETAAFIQSDFPNGGEYAFTKMVLNRKSREKAVISVQIVDDGSDLPAGSSFIILAVLQS